MSYIDEIQGKRFGRLVVVDKVYKNHRREALCKCDCGAEKLVSARMLKRGDTTSCGCLHKEVVSEMRQIDLSGKTFGRLLVVGRGKGKYVGTKNRFDLSWICVCECGKEVDVVTSALTSGNTSSCGCWAANRKSGNHGKFHLSSKVNRMKDGAKRRGIEWSIPTPDAEKIITSNCSYCGAQPDRKYGPFLYHGIDRIDSSEPYELGNVVPCCKRCNFAKNDLSVTEFKSHIELIYNNFVKGH